MNISTFMAPVMESPGAAKKDQRRFIGIMDLSHKHDAYVDSLSRGMKQRLCLARSLVHDPALLVLDEPASGLDPRARVEMREILKELRNMGKTIMISSHILPELTELCSHIGIIEAGQMVACGTVEEIMRFSQLGGSLKITVLGQLDETVRLLKEQLPSVKWKSMRKPWRCRLAGMSRK
jgi:ABC-2 type transport system ATP-binding protein